MSSNNSVKNESLPASVWLLFIAIATTLMGLGFMAPVLPTISQQLSASPSETTLLYTSYNAVMAIVTLITGVISTRLGIRKTLILSVSIIGVFAFIAGFSNNIWTIVGLRGFWGVGNSLFFATSLTAMVALAGIAKTRSIVLYEAAVGIGISVGPLIGGILGQFSWRYAFMGVSALTAVVFVLLVIYLPNVKEKSSKKQSKTSLLDPFHAMKHRSIASLGTACCLYNFGFFVLLAYAPFVLKLSPFEIGSIFLGQGVFLALTSYFIAPKLKKRFGAIKPLNIFLVLFTVLLLVMGIGTYSVPLLAAGIVFSGALIGNLNGLFSNAVMDASPVEASTTSAAFSFLRLLGGVIAPFTAALLGEIFSPHAPFFFGGSLVLIAAVIVLLNRHYLNQQITKETMKEKPKAAILKVKDFMIHEVVSIKPDATAKELLKLLTEHHIGGVPVVDNQNKLIGMVSDGDIIRYLAPKEKAVRDFIYDIFVEEEETEQEVLKEKINTTLDKFMHKQPIYAVKEEDTFESAIHILSQHHFKQIPVLDSGGKVRGIISRWDIDKNLMKILSQK